MNTCSIVGNLIDHATARGAKSRVLAFTVETIQAAKNKEEDYIEHVPVVLFNPPADLETRLITAGKGTLVAFTGRIHTSRFEGQDGQARYSTDVVAYNSAFAVLS